MYTLCSVYQRLFSLKKGEKSLFLFKNILTSSYLWNQISQHKESIRIGLPLNDCKEWTNRAAENGKGRPSLPIWVSNYVSGEKKTYISQWHKLLRDEFRVLASEFKPIVLTPNNTGKWYVTFSRSAAVVSAIWSTEKLPETFTSAFSLSVRVMNCRFE